MLGAGGVTEGHRKLTKARGSPQDGKVLYDDDDDGSDDDQDDGNHNDDIYIMMKCMSVKFWFTPS